MSAVNDRWETDILADLIAKKHELLVQLHDLTRQQVTMVTENDMRELMTVLSAKQTLLNQVQRLEGGLDHFRQQDPDQRKWRTTEDRLRVRSLADHCQQLVNELVQIEKSCEASMIQRRDEVADQLNMAGNAASARAAYVNQSRPTSGGFDIQSEA